VLTAITESQRTAAKVAGIAFLFTDVTATFAEFYVRPTLIVQNNAAQTAANIMATGWLFRLGIAIQLTMIAGLLVLTAALYVVLKPAGPGLAVLGASWRLTENALLAVGTLTSLNVVGLLSGAATLRGLQAGQLQALAMRSINAYEDAYSVSLLFGGLGLAVFAYLFVLSGYIPRPLAVWGVFGALLTAASTLTFIVFPGLASVAKPWVFAPLLIFELGTAFWLLIRGLPQSQASGLEGS
jgi:hypothetical protein